MEINLMGEGDSEPPTFDPEFEVLKPHLHIRPQDFHFNIAVGPKVGLNLNLFDFGMGFGVRFDALRMDTKLAEYTSMAIHL